MTRLPYPLPVSRHVQYRDGRELSLPEGWDLRGGKLRPPTVAQQVADAAAGRPHDMGLEWQSAEWAARWFYRQRRSDRLRVAHGPGCPYEGRWPGWLLEEWAAARVLECPVGARVTVSVCMQCPPWVRRTEPLPLP